MKRSFKKVHVDQNDGFFYLLDDDELWPDKLI